MVFGSTVFLSFSDTYLVLWNHCSASTFYWHDLFGMDFLKKKKKNLFEKKIETIYTCFKNVLDLSNFTLKVFNDSC